MAKPPLDADALCRRCDPRALPFITTQELVPLTERVGQARAEEALQFGVSMRHEGYNLFAMGPSGSGKYTAVRATIEARAALGTTPSDLCYVSDFADPHAPRAVHLPPGRGKKLKSDVAQLVEELRTVIPGALETDEFRARKQAIEDELKTRQSQAFDALRQRGTEKSIALLQTPMGLALAPMKDGEVIPPDAFQKLPEEERTHWAKDIEALGTELRARLEEMPRWEQDARRRVKALVRETVAAAVAHLIGDLRAAWADLPGVLAHLSAFEQDVLENAGDFLRAQEGPPAALVIDGEGNEPFRRYRVNVLVDHGDTLGAPVVYEDHPVFENLVGRIEHIPRLGALVTDFSLVKAGALHRANGGYLLLDARNLLTLPYAWEGLKRALYSKQVRVESLGQVLGLAGTVSLEPEPVALDVKIVLLGERRLYYLLDSLDPDFRALFKVAVDFEDEVPRTAETDVLYARLVATIARDEKLCPFDAPAVARVIEHAARLAEDAERLSTHMGSLVDLAREADHHAVGAGREVVGRDDVEAAIGAAERRAGRIRERSLEQITRGTMMVETSGERVGQVNGLAVMSLGGSSFGRPSRITARVRLGRGEVVDIEREVELGGPLHSKGVLILSAFLGARYAQERPLSLAATLAFEQSYGGVDGDSASSTELYALLSAIGEVPLRQSIAVTGSVSQHGFVQPIGGVNEKIEGFFDVCRARGLTGAHGVIIPRTNEKHLMLRADVVDAVREGKFHVWSVDTIDEGIELLTGIPAGERDVTGRYPEGTINARVEARLDRLSELRAKLGRGDVSRGGPEV
jgi:lon-related putative ATP-dependent protease